MRCSPIPVLRPLGPVTVALCLLLLAGCTSGSGPTAGSNPPGSSQVLHEVDPPSETHSGLISETDREFCEAYGAFWNTGPDAEGGLDDTRERSDQAFHAAMDLAPAELASAARVLRAGNDDGPTQELFDALQELTFWVADHCTDRENPLRRIAPPTAPEGYISCGDLTGPWSFWPEEPDASMIIYGNPSATDPYTERLIAVLTDIRLDPGDGPSTDITVNGVPAVTGPAGVFQAVSSSELAHVVVWMLDGIEVTVFGRGYSEGDTQDLVRFAEGVQLIDGRAVHPASKANVLYEGSTTPLSAITPFWPRSPNYSLNYRRPSELGLLSVHGLTMDAQTFAATRAFFSDSELTTFNGHEGFVAAAWDESGPFLAAWREPDDAVVWITGIAASKAEIIAVAEDSVELDAAQWKVTSRMMLACDQR